MKSQTAVRTLSFLFHSFDYDLAHADAIYFTYNRLVFLMLRASAQIHRYASPSPRPPCCMAARGA